VPIELLTRAAATRPVSASAKTITPPDAAHSAAHHNQHTNTRLEAKLRKGAQSSNKPHRQFPVSQRCIAKSVPKSDSPGEEMQSV
jgi:hypothetical protein